ncbi:hypothetical protein KVF89_06585 [Nocardioides carbamazepini]|uniref:hypothetical protein n=1 Tax=Nocardioides carbamazepini TaxID=2854259 RepID=UPI002149CB3D|nr:hypothetical protein [Nocardioides carbamazepini]MCR1782193.1 hypothetical protein [Nocardioides carbamazepini]
MISRVVRPALRPMLAGLLVLALAGCSDDDRSGPGADPTTASTTGTTATTPTDTGSPAPTPSVAPATGTEISVESVSMRLTASPDWKVSRFGTTVTGGLYVEGAGIVNATVTDILAGPGLDTEDKAVSYERSLAGTPLPPTRVADRVVDGTTCFVLEARTGEGHRYIVGGVTGGRFFSVEFVVPATVPDGDQLIEQMLASVEIAGQG